MWFVYLRTSLATSEGVLMFSSAPTAPARFVGPCMQEASSCTTPAALGSPPYPTESSFGSSSWIFTPSTAASSGSAPCRIRSNACCTARRPLPLEMRTGLAAQRVLRGRGRGGRIGCGMPRVALAASPPAVDSTNWRRVSTSGTARSVTGVMGFSQPPGPCQLARCETASYVPVRELRSTQPARHPARLLRRRARRHGARAVRRVHSPRRRELEARLAGAAALGDVRLRRRRLPDRGGAARRILEPRAVGGRPDHHPRRGDRVPRTADRRPATRAGARDPVRDPAGREPPQGPVQPPEGRGVARPAAREIPRLPGAAGCPPPPLLSCRWS